ncbi:MAG: protein translocase subunit SecD, partial [Rhodospirillaceae bacterium]|nr:protein translocase subunit SecD [Rhodospirillaceae bacterium]
MVNYPRWAIVTTVVIALLGLIYAAPNFFPLADEAVETSGLLPSKRMNLGLDLQGGSSLLLSVGVDTAIRETLESVESTVRRELRQRGARVGYSGLRVEGKAVAFTLRNATDSDTARDRLRNIEDGFDLDIADDVNFRLSMSEDAERARRQSAVEQSIEIVRRRVDETGVAEPVIQQQGDSRILVQLPGIKDPERIKRLLGQTAKLNFHMLDETVSIQEAESGTLPAGSMLLYGPEEEGRIPYVVRRTVEVGGDRLVDAQPTFQDGQPIVSFRFDAAGGRRFGELTSQNVGRRLAIVLDREVVSAPRIQTAINGGSGIITGRFTPQEVTELSILLRAGALPAPLTVLEERTVGPGLGADSIEAGKIASIIGLAAVVVFIVISYGLFGLMAAIALLFNLSLIVALLSVLQATLTLPGIAGIV